MVTGRTFLIGAVAAGFLFAATLLGQPATGTLTVTLTVEPSLSLVIDPPAGSVTPTPTAAQPLYAIALDGPGAVSHSLDAGALARENGSVFRGDPRRNGPVMREAMALPTARAHRKPLRGPASRRRS